MTHAQNFRLSALALSADRSPQDGTAPRSSPPSPSLLLKAFADSAVLAKAATVSVKVHCPNSDPTIIDSALAPTLTTLSANANNLYKIAAKLCSKFFFFFFAVNCDLFVRDKLNRLAAF